MFNMMRGSLFAVLLSLLAIPAGGTSGELWELHPNLAPGSQSSMYGFPDAPDEVNLFNGNLHLSVPIGLSYPVSEDFRYQLVLHYNSNVWRRTQVDATTVRADPVPLSKAGFGWDLSLGRLWSPQSNPTGLWIYVAPDGARHAFYPTLHSGVAENDPGNIALYTRDGTYLRLKLVSSSERIVEFPDGSWKLFRDAGGDWLLADHRNSTGMGYSVVHFPDRWEVHDDHGRVHRVHFRTDTTGSFGGIVDRVEVSAFGGAQAVYRFTYTNESFARGCVDNDPATGDVSVPFLSRVDLPDGTQYSFAHRAGTSNCHEIGRISSVQLPTLGRIDYFYGWQPFVQAGWGHPMDCPTELPSALVYASGVNERQTYDASGAQLGAWTIYRYARRMYGGTECVGPLDLVADLYDPNGDLERRFFNITSSSQSWERGTYGYPLTYAFGWAGRRLSAQTFDCDPGPRGVNCVSKRNRWVRFEHDSGVEPLVSTGADRNRREAEWAVEYLDDRLPSGAWANLAVTRRHFDGLGHYREVETSDNWGSTPAEVLTTEYNAAQGDFPSASWSMPAPSAPWILDTFSKQVHKWADGSEHLTKELCYDETTGLLKGVRTLKAPLTRGGNDLLETYEYDGWGNRIRMSYYGGDTQTLPTSSACAVPSTGYQYATARSFVHGSLAWETSLDTAGNAIPPWEVDRDIDHGTGLVAAERESAGLEMTFDYDVSGQVSAVMRAPGHGAWLLTTREPPNGTSGGAVTVEMVPNGGGIPYTTERHELDNFGRVTYQERAMPGGETATRTVEHDAMGRVTRLWDWGASAPTQYLAYDPFGRLLHVRPPDGAEHDTTHSWKGDRVRETRGSAWFYIIDNEVQEGEYKYTETFDRGGQLVRRTSHPMIAQEPDHSTTHTYDLAGHRLWSALDGEQVGETRTYDGRGLLTRVDTTAGAVTTYSYDAWRLASRVTHDRYVSGVLWEQKRQEVINLYDPKGRLVRAEDPTGYTWKMFVYANQNDGTNLQSGKLRQQVRNIKRWDGEGSTTVTEAFTYAGLGGRLSKTELTVSGHQGSFVTELAYDELGRPSTLTYPRCVGCRPETVKGTIMRNLFVDNLYEGSMLTTVRTRDSTFGTDSTSTEYHPNGLPSEISYPTGTVEHWTSDPSGIPRVAEVLIQPPNARHTAYDEFRYDGTGRLLSVREPSYRLDEYHFFVPEYRSYSEPLGPAPSTTFPCEGWPSHYRDPFGVSNGVGWDDWCNPTMAIYVNANDETVLVERLSNQIGVDGIATWFGYGPRGELLTEYDTWLYANYVWRETRDYVYRDGLLHKEIVRTPNEGSTWTFYHHGHGAPGVETSGEW